KSLGLKGAKLHADFQGIAIDDPRCYKIYEILESENLPALLHTGDARFNFSNPDNLVPVLRAFKKLTVVGAHFGGWSVWKEAAGKLAGFENLYVDTSSTFGCTSVEFVGKLLSKYDADRVMFGVDYPMWNPGDELDSLFSLKLSDEHMRKILGGNCARVYGIEKY
ncbi:MAG: amidohydrolase family protein, partial [Firmicutes bacterium]|nr:amidohydrolase family protein [Bacillota bacterium]